MNLRVGLVRGFKARTLALFTLACLLVAAQVNYAVSGNTAYVTYSFGASGNIVIASTYNGYPVTSIVGRAFEGASGLRSVTIPSSVTNIGLTNQTIVVEASTNLANWQPIWTNSMPAASTNFVDPEWLQHPRRFYRARSD